MLFRREPGFLLRWSGPPVRYRWRLAVARLGPPVRWRGLSAVLWPRAGGALYGLPSDTRI
jgi:hypothetical protein